MAGFDLQGVELGLREHGAIEERVDIGYFGASKREVQAARPLSCVVKPFRTTKWWLGP
jgi:hypothetical protein